MYYSSFSFLFSSSLFFLCCVSSYLDFSLPFFLPSKQPSIHQSSYIYIKTYYYCWYVHMYKGTVEKGKSDSSFGHFGHFGSTPATVFLRPPLDFRTSPGLPSSLLSRTALPRWPELPLTLRQGARVIERNEWVCI